MGKKWMIILIVLAAGIIVAVGALGIGKSKKTQTTPAPTAEAVSSFSSSEKVTEAAVSAISAEAIGEKTTGDNVYKVTLINNTQRIITGVTVKDLTESEYPANMRKDGDVFQPNEKRDLYFDATESVKKTEELNRDSSYSDEEKVEPDYTLKVTFDAGKSYELHSFPFGDISEGQLCYDEQEDVCYLTYTSLKSGERVSTLEQEKQRKALAAQNESATVNEGASDGTDTQEDPSYESNPSYEEPTGDTPQEETPSFSVDEQDTYGGDNNTY